MPKRASTAINFMALSIGEAASQLGLSVDTLRYYEKIKLIPPPPRDSGGRRYYTEKDISTLRFVKRAQAVGFSLDEIGQLLHFRSNPRKASRRVRELANSRYVTVNAKLQELERLRDELALLLQICSGDDEECPILDSLESSE